MSNAERVRHTLDGERETVTQAVDALGEDAKAALNERLAEQAADLLGQMSTLAGQTVRGDAPGCGGDGAPGRAGGGDDERAAGEPRGGTQP